MIKDIYKRILFLLSVPKCVCCNEILDYEDRCFCKDCKTVYEQYKTRNCPKCAKLLNECSCASEVMKANGFKTVIKLYRYRYNDQNIPSNRIIYALKEQNRDDVFDQLADELSVAIANSIKLDKKKILITNIPRRQRSIDKFGYDHAAVLAKRVSKRLNLNYLPTLISKSKKAQKQTQGAQRMQNASFTIRKGIAETLKGKTVIIIDDIITTGSSMIAAGELIRKCGARKTIAAAVAISKRQ